ncbi:MAG: DUF4160 domain-containing protein [Saprospiraceae bacterium]|nr:DUF4160 domain-containing protein [Saprospiraceae bacterium]
MNKKTVFYGIIVYMYFDDHNPPHFHLFIFICFLMVRWNL